MNVNDEYSTVNLSYAILRNDDPFKLEILVIEYMEEGWEPIGGISVSNIQSPHRGAAPQGYYYTQYTQAMVRK